ncbi:MAG TPA: branched chain amino acid aminotransferase [Deltaproteobacteria bacterium]|nr:branched chain amino acid aminotransferase [Deltaproteobacteria bacterium]
MGIESRLIWMDGEFIPFADATVHVLSHTLHYGLGVFEGIRAYQQPDGSPGIFRLDEHLERLVDSARMCHIPLRYTVEDLREACLETLRVNGFKSAYIRPLVFLGSGAMGLGTRNNQVHVCIATWEWGAYLGSEGLEKGVRVACSSFSRHHVNANLQRAKVVGHYVNSILARYEANDNGFDEAIMLDTNGLVAEGTGENIFLVRRNVVTTPPVINILGGITRDTVIEILRHDGFDIREQQFGRDALYIADEMFMVGTAAEVTPIREVDRREIGPPGKFTKHIQQVYNDGVHGRVPWMIERGWITLA